MRFVFSFLLLFGLAAPLYASEAPAAPADPAQERAWKREALAKRLGQPATEEQVKACVRRALADDAADALVAIQALRIARGPHAVDGLIGLTRHGEGAVRVAAWQGVAALASRRDEVVDLAARELLILSTPKETEGVAATLGRVGDARHLPMLFEVAASENEAQRKSAFAALRALTGVRLPDRLSHWMSWWRLRKRRGSDDLVAALDAIEHNRTKKFALQQRIIVRDAWFDVPLVRETLQVWLRVHDPRLRLAAVKLVAELRLGDLINDVDSVGRYGQNDDVRKAADATLKALHVPPEAWRKKLLAKTR